MVVSGESKTFGRTADPDPCKLLSSLTLHLQPLKMCVERYKSYIILYRGTMVCGVYRSFIFLFCDRSIHVYMNWTHNVNLLNVPGMYFYTVLGDVWALVCVIILWTDLEWLSECQQVCQHCRSSLSWGGSVWYCLLCLYDVCFRLQQVLFPVMCTSSFSLKFCGWVFIRRFSRY